VTKFYSMEK